MKKDCLDIGIIQALMDGELANDKIGMVSGHIATCDACAMILADAEDESAIVFPALEREFNTLVPTQRLWNKINGAIENERDSAPFWAKAWAFVKVGLASPSLAFAAGFLVVAGLSSPVWISQNSTSDLVVTLPENTSTFIPRPSVIDPVVIADDIVVASTVSYSKPISPKAIVVNASVPKKGVLKTEKESPVIVTLPGEESYMKTIASLAKTVDLQKDSVMRPAERIGYERDMAVVNDAISKMRTEVKLNPKNDSAKQLLYSSYQNKIDLLNSVSQKEELVASLK